MRRLVSHLDGAEQSKGWPRPGGEGTTLRSVPVSASASCRNHPDREAIGVCVRCRTRVCGECTTKVDGINFCVTCLGSMAKADKPVASAGSGALAYPAAFAWVVVISLLCWSLLAGLPGG